jgi:hypothetical protein
VNGKANIIVRFEVLTVASMKIASFWDITIALMMETVRTSEISVYFHANKLAIS